MPTAEERIKAIGIELPPPPSAVGNYVTWVRTGNLVFLSGMLPFDQGKILRQGRVGRDLSPEEAKADARTAALNALAVLRNAIGSLDNVSRCIKITGFVASADEFTGQPGVINGASDLMAEVFGEAGKHARAAIGVNVLPLNSPLEIEFIFEVKP